MRDAHGKGRPQAAFALVRQRFQRVAQKPMELISAPGARVAFQPAPEKLTVLPDCDQVAFHIWFSLPCTCRLARQVAAVLPWLTTRTLAQ